MRRSDREITDIGDIIDIIKKCDVCRLALFDSEYPYIVPLNFGYSVSGDKVELYFHGAGVGKKINLIKQNNHVFFEMDCSHRLITGDLACKYTMEYESVMGKGTIEILNNEEKRDALTLIMRQYSQEREFNFDEEAVDFVTVLKLAVNHITGKRLKRLI